MPTVSTIAQPRYQRQSCGFTLTEMAIVLAIVGLVLGAIWIAFTQLSLNNQVRAASQQLAYIVQNVRPNFAEHAVIDTGGGALSQALDQLHAFPLDMRQNPSTPAGILFNNWSQQIAGGVGTVYVYADNCAGAANATGAAQPCFGVTFLNVPTNACAMLLMQTSQPSMGLQEIIVNTVDIGDVNGGGPLPVFPSAAAAACNNGGATGQNDMIWIYSGRGSNS